MANKPQVQPHVFVGTPVYKDLPLEFLASLQKLMNSKPPFLIVTNYFDSCLVHYSRNRIVKNFLKYSECEWLFWIDSDMIYEPEDFLKLYEGRQSDTISSGLYVQRKQPCRPTPGFCNVKTKWKEQGITDWDDKVFEVDYCGLGFCLTHRSVYEKMKEPWFNYRQYKDGTMLGEDTTFCLKAKELGFKVTVDPEIQIGHIGSYIYTPLDYLALKQVANEHTTTDKPIS
jgi:hypothetical protein